MTASPALKFNHQSFTYNYKAIMEWISNSEPRYVWLGDVWKKSYYTSYIATKYGWKVHDRDAYIPYGEDVTVFT